MFIEIKYFVISFLLNGQVIPTVMEFNNIEDCRIEAEQFQNLTPITVACVVHYDTIMIPTKEDKPDE